MKERRCECSLLYCELHKSYWTQRAKGYRTQSNIISLVHRSYAMLMLYYAFRVR